MGADGVMFMGFQGRQQSQTLSGRSGWAGIGEPVCKTQAKVAQRSEEVTWWVLRGDASERLLSHHRSLGNCAELEGGL